MRCVIGCDVVIYVVTCVGKGQVLRAPWGLVLGFPNADTKCLNGCLFFNVCLFGFMSSASEISSVCCDFLHSLWNKFLLACSD